MILFVVLNAVQTVLFPQLNHRHCQLVLLHCAGNTGVSGLAVHKTQKLSVPKLVSVCV